MSTNQVDALIQAAQGAMAAGRFDEADRIWNNVLSQASEHPGALLYLGQRATQARNFAAALSLLNRAKKAAPNDPAVRLNLAICYRMQGDADGEMSALIEALSLDPYFYPALLARGTLEERLGLINAAAASYRNVIKIIPPLNQVPPQLHAALKHAQDVVNQSSEVFNGFLQKRIDNLRARYPEQNWERLIHAKDILTGRRKVYMPEPETLLIPYLPPLQFYDDTQFPWLEKLEAATSFIRDEFVKIYEEDNRDGFRPYINRPAHIPLNQWAELNQNPRWSVFPLWQNGERIDRNCARAPRTTAFLEALPLCHIPNFAPNVVFSLLAPKTTIPAHSGDTNARLIGHLPLIVPQGCRFRVGNETREWSVGKAWIFDDTVNHEAWNDSDDLRVILMIDVWNPYLSAPECELVSDLLNAKNEFMRMSEISSAVSQRIRT